MARRSELTPAGMMEFLLSFYPKRVTIRRRVEGADEHGQPLDEFETVYQNVACRIAPARGNERKTETISYSVGQYTISAVGCLRLVSPAMQVVDETSGQIYEISAPVDVDSQDMTSRITVEIVK